MVCAMVERIGLFFVYIFSIYLEKIFNFGYNFYLKHGVEK